MLKRCGKQDNTVYNLYNSIYSTFFSKQNYADIQLKQSHGFLRILFLVSNRFDLPSSPPSTKARGEFGHVQDFNVIQQQEKIKRNSLSMYCT
jgi:hypothetical protein